jgi:4-hydroxybenzoate polyprenyltransferase
MTNRWWTYQQERFPIFAHGPLVVVFCLAVMLFSALQLGDELPAMARIAGAFVSTLILFFQLRVADEFKDFEIDAKYRPHRAVPRGLVSLNELARLAYVGAAIQFLIALSIDIGLIPILIGVWAYIGLMTKEFFVKDWLLRNPAVYLVSHMLVMPLIAFYVSTFDWLYDSRDLPAGLGWLLLLSFCCGLVLELGRKIKVPANERAGVETYSGLWGSKIAITLWTASVAASVFAYANAASYISGSALFLNLGATVLVIGLVTAVLFPGRGPQPFRGADKLIEPSSGLVALLLYLGLGPLQAMMG